jgi:ferritin-like metal-binding protein YciE
MAETTEMKDLLIHELKDILYAERRFATGTRHLVQETSDPEIKARLEQHVEETENQIKRVEKAFESIGEKPKGERCEAAIGLREEHDSFKKEEKPSKPILEAFDLGSGLRVEHYEIAAYRSAIAIGRLLGYKECVSLLQENLREEEDMARFLEEIAPKALAKLMEQTEA